MLPPDVQNVGHVRLATRAEGADAISLDAAIRAAPGDSLPGGDAYLVMVTTETTSSTDEPIVNRLVWLLRWTDLLIGQPQPSRLEGTHPPQRPSNKYVLIDALDGDFLFATYVG